MILKKLVIFLTMPALLGLAGCDVITGGSDDGPYVLPDGYTYEVQDDQSGDILDFTIDSDAALWVVNIRGTLNYVWGGASVDATTGMKVLTVGAIQAGPDFLDPPAIGDLLYVTEARGSFAMIHFGPPSDMDGDGVMDIQAAPGISIAACPTAGRNFNVVPFSKMQDFTLEMNYGSAAMTVSGDVVTLTPSNFFNWDGVGLVAPTDLVGTCSGGIAVKTATSTNGTIYNQTEIIFTNGGIVLIFNYQDPASCGGGCGGGGGGGVMLLPNNSTPTNTEIYNTAMAGMLDSVRWEDDTFLVTNPKINETWDSSFVNLVGNGSQIDGAGYINNDFLGAVNGAEGAVVTLNSLLPDGTTHAGQFNFLFMGTPMGTLTATYLDDSGDMFALGNMASMSLLGVDGQTPANNRYGYESSSIFVFQQ